MTLTAPALIRYAGPPAVPGYAVGELLGRGATGVVWSATRRETGDRVALKVLEPDLDPVELAAVDREESLGAQLSGAHVLTVRGRVALGDGRLALEMDLADGGSLRDVVTVRGALPVGEVVTALTPLATALADLHRVGVVHADVAPGNVLFTTDGRPMLADLSTAWLVDDGWPTRSMGTPGFAAPEVTFGRPPLPASDVWSLGALAWYARSGGLTPPEWVGDLHWSRGMAAGDPGDVGDLADPEHLEHPDDDELERGTVADLGMVVGPELTPLLVRMLAADPDSRPSAAEVAVALYRAAAPEPVVLVGHHPDPAAAVTTRIRRDAAETRSRVERREAERAERRGARRERRRRRFRTVLIPWVGAADRPPGPSPVPLWRSRLVVVGLVGLVLAAGMLGLLWLAGGPREPALTSVVDRPTTDPGAGEASAGEHPTGTSTGDIGPAGGRAATEAASSSATDVGTPASAGAVTGDPVAALQRVADLRAVALVAADPVMLVNAEPAGSTAHETDVRTVTRLRQQGQRYAGLSFTVRSAEVISAAAASVVLRAVVDRSGYQVVGDGGTADELAPAAGTTLSYTLALADGVWRLTGVGPP